MIVRLSGPFAGLESDAQARADVSSHVGNLDEPIRLPWPAPKFAVVRVVEIILLHAVSLVEGELTRHLGLSVSRRKDLEDDLRRDARLFPLLVRPARSLGPAQRDQASGAVRIFGSPSTAYQSRSPATKTLGSLRKTASSPSLIVTIHLNWSVFSAMGLPSLSGYIASTRRGVLMRAHDRAALSQRVGSESRSSVQFRTVEPSLPDRLAL